MLCWFINKLQTIYAAHNDQNNSMLCKLPGLTGCILKTYEVHSKCTIF